MILTLRWFVRCAMYERCVGCDLFVVRHGCVFAACLFFEFPFDFTYCAMCAMNLFWARVFMLVK